MRSRLFSVRPRTTNIGNDLIGLGTDAMLADVWRDPLDIVTLPAVGAAGTTKGSGLDARNVYEINQLGDGVLVGGGNLFENGGLNVEPAALAALTAPLGVIGVSSGRVYGRGGLTPRTDALAPERVAALCAAADPLLVRDDATAALLADAGVAHAVVAGCPALFLDRFVRDLPPADETLAGTALLSLRHPRLMSLPYAEQDAVRADVRRLAAGLAGQFDRVALVCHDYQDLAFAAAFPEFEALYTEDVRQFVSWIRGCAVAVGYRLHGFLACVALGTPAVHVSYDERGEAMVDTLGLDDWNVRMPHAVDVPGDVLARVREAIAAGTAPRLDAQPALDRLLPEMLAGLELFAARTAATHVPTAALS